MGELYEMVPRQVCVVKEDQTALFGHALSVGVDLTLNGTVLTPACM